MAHSRSSSTTSSASSASSRRNVGGLPCLSLPSLSTSPCAWWNASFDELDNEDEEEDHEESFCLEYDLFLAECSSSSSVSPSAAHPDDECSSACSTQSALIDDIFTCLESVDALLAFFPSPLPSRHSLSHTTSWDTLPDSDDDDDYTSSSDEEFEANLCVFLDFSSSSSSSSSAFSSPTTSGCTTPDDFSYSSFVDFSDPPNTPLTSSLSFNTTTTGSTASNGNRVGQEAGEKTSIPLASSSTSSSLHPPPSHPSLSTDTLSMHSSTSTYVPSSVASSTASTTSTRTPAASTTTDETRNSVASRVSGLFGAIHGAGEAIRGTINSGLDGLGDGVTGRPQGTATSRTSAAGEESVAQKGVAEFQKGVDALKGEHHASSTTNSTSSL
ncbi:hypothetical protein JCM8547_006207 [Rhodosporidiobolus lusitaniae]